MTSSKWQEKQDRQRNRKKKGKIVNTAQKDLYSSPIKFKSLLNTENTTISQWKPLDQKVLKNFCQFWSEISYSEFTLYFDLESLCFIAQLFGFAMSFLNAVSGCPLPILMLYSGLNALTLLIFLCFIVLSSPQGGPTGTLSCKLKPACSTAEKTQRMHEQIHRSAHERYFGNWTSHALVWCRFQRCTSRLQVDRPLLLIDALMLTH